MIRRCCWSGAPDVADLWRLLMVASADELRPIVAGTPAQPFLEARQRPDVRIDSVGGRFRDRRLRVRRRISEPDLFSVRHWVENPRLPEHVVHSVPRRPDRRVALDDRHLDASRDLRSDEPVARTAIRRLWFVIDELDALGAIDGLEGCAGATAKIWGPLRPRFSIDRTSFQHLWSGEAQTVVENCGNTLILRCSGSENGGTSQFASRLIGEREIVRRQTSRGNDRESTFASRGARRSRSVHRSPCDGNRGAAPPNSNNCRTCAAT